MYARNLEYSPGRIFAIDGVLVVVPFLLFVLGLDSKRWEDHYWFSDTGKADARRTWNRWAVYFIGGLLGYAMT